MIILKIHGIKVVLWHFTTLILFYFFQVRYKLNRTWDCLLQRYAGKYWWNNNTHLHLVESAHSQQIFRLFEGCGCISSFFFPPAFNHKAFETRWIFWGFVDVVFGRQAESPEAVWPLCPLPEGPQGRPETQETGRNSLGGLLVNIFMGSFSVYACEGITSRAYLIAVLTENEQNESRCNLTPLRNSCRQTLQPVPPVHGHCVSLLSVIIFRLKRKWDNRPWVCTPASSDSSWKRWESGLEGYSGLWWGSGWSVLEQSHLSGAGHFLCAPPALTEQQRSVSHTDRIWVLLRVQSHSPLPKRHPTLPLWEIKRNVSNL